MEPAFRKTVKISSKGQITLPKRVRERLQQSLVEVVSDEQGVRLEPLRSAAGSLREYAKKYIPIEEARDVAWTEATKRLVVKDGGRRRS